MNHKGTNEMTRYLVVLLLLAIAGTTSAQNLNGKPFIAVQGHAERQFVPDVFPLTVTLNETSMDADRAQKHVEDLAAQVLAVTAALKMADVDIDVGNLSISPQTKYDDVKEAAVFIGNAYERKIQLRFHSLADVRSFLGLVPTGKNVQIETESFVYSGEVEAKKQLMLQAIADAKATAERMAQGVGKRLLSLHNVSDRPQGDSYTRMGISSFAVTGTRLNHSSNIVLKEGVITLTEDAYVIYLIGD
jgi:uncharacterized protein YggE